VNLVLITIDCLRADHLGCLGYPKKITPNLDRLASTGTLFTQAISVSHGTPSSFISIFASAYPLMYKGRLWLTDYRTTLAQLLKEHGYHTAGFHSNPYLSSCCGFSKGFETFHDSLPHRRREGQPRKANESTRCITSARQRLYKFLRRIYAGPAAEYPYCKGEDLNRKAIPWLHANPSNFFLWVHYMDAHEPYTLSSRFAYILKGGRVWEVHRKAHTAPGSLSPQEVNGLISLYDGGIRYADRMIGSLLRELQRSNTLADTFIIVTADHGQEFLEHEYYGHGLHLYDELIHVPLVITGPGLGNKVIRQQVSIIDLAPTILDILHIEKPRAFLGKSLLPLITAQDVRAGDSEAISEGATDVKREMEPKVRFDRSDRMLSLRTSKWKYIYTEGKQHELYDLQSDPKETRNLIDAKPEIGAELRAKIVSHIEFEEECTLGEEELIKAKIKRLKRAGKI